MCLALINFLVTRVLKQFTKKLLAWDRNTTLVTLDLKWKLGFLYLTLVCQINGPRLPPLPCFLIFQFFFKVIIISRYTIFDIIFVTDLKYSRIFFYESLLIKDSNFDENASSTTVSLNIFIFVCKTLV